MGQVGQWLSLLGPFASALSASPSHPLPWSGCRALWATGPEGHTSVSFCGSEGGVNVSSGSGVGKPPPLMAGT